MENASISNTNTNNASSTGGFEINSVLNNISISIKKELTPFIRVVEKSNRNMDILKQMLIMLPEYTELRDKYDNLLVENEELKAKLGNSSNIHLKINRLPAKEEESEALPDKTIVSASISNEFKTNEVITEGAQTKVENDEECESEYETDEEDLTSDRKRNCEEEDEEGETEYETDEEGEEEDLSSDRKAEGDRKSKVENDDDCEEEDLTSDSKAEGDQVENDEGEEEEEGETEYETDEEDEEDEEDLTSDRKRNCEEDLTSDRKRNCEEEDLTSDRKRKVENDDDCEEEDAKQPIKERKVPV